MALEATGNIAPSPNPSRTRATMIASSPLANPIDIVARPTMIPQAVRVRRAPIVSPSQPPRIWNTR